MMPKPMAGAWTSFSCFSVAGSNSEVFLQRPAARVGAGGVVRLVAAAGEGDRAAGLDRDVSHPIPREAVFLVCRRSRGRYLCGAWPGRSRSLEPTPQGPIN
jgi:hypothetical protein